MEATMSQDGTYRRPWLRFSLATFLFACLCVGGLIAGYQSGYRAGYQVGSEARYDNSQAVETYNCASYVWADRSAEGQLEDINKLVDLIRSTIAPDIWSSPQNEIRVFPSNHSLVITAPGSVHHEIRQLLAQIDNLSGRRLASKLQLVPGLQQLVAVGQSGAVAFPFDLPGDSRLAMQWLEETHRISADEVSKLWGRPRFDGACTDKGFPQWSVDQKLVTWKRQNGVAFVSLRYLDDGKLYLMTGFQKDG
jgi:hypothetical protein